MELQPLIDEYIQNPNEAVLNWNLAQWYEYNGHLAAALSYYIRTAERSDDKKIQYESLIRGAECYYRQNMRNFTVRHVTTCYYAFTKTSRSILAL